MITEDYASYEVAKLLKEKGFDGVCRYYYPDGHTNLISYVDCRQFDMFNHESCIAPTLQMACKWLREEYNIFIVIEPHTYDYINEKNSSYVASLWQGDNYCENVTSKDYPTYEEAIEAAIKYTLENLI